MTKSGRDSCFRLTHWEVQGHPDRNKPDDFFLAYGLFPHRAKRMESVMRKVWERCFDERPGLGVRLRGCARILIDNEEIYFELWIPSEEKRWKLSDACFKIGNRPVSLEACIIDVKWNGQWPEALVCKVEGCWHIPVWQDCETLWEGEIRLGRIPWGDLSEFEDGNLINRGEANSDYDDVLVATEHHLPSLSQVMSRRMHAT
ncbi:hypothetical protein [uncultured Jannaschia sp.]|uniref:hypothetical protein n=1 Tax=uncultured Jannaschia sp. TaxID=293347 RepID=UPI00260803F0|nr:hypothetical protein [uncultured Jannaschia sp.]